MPIQTMSTQMIFSDFRKLKSSVQKVAKWVTTEQSPIPRGNQRICKCICYGWPCRYCQRFSMSVFFFARHLFKFFFHFLHTRLDFLVAANREHEGDNSEDHQANRDRATDQDRQIA